MTYEYNLYYINDCIVPLGFGSFALILLISAIIGFFINKRTIISSKEEMVKWVLMLCVMAFLLSKNAFHLYQGGIYLLFEKEADQLQISGTIEDTIELTHLTGGGYHDIEQNHGYGEAIVINGKKYYLTTYGEFSVGDHVILNVLPRSGFVLKMVEQSENGPIAEGAFRGTVFHVP